MRSVASIVLASSIAIAPAFAAHAHIRFSTKDQAKPATYLKSLGNGQYTKTVWADEAAVFDIPAEGGQQIAIPVVGADAKAGALGLASLNPASFHYVQYGQGLFSALVANTPITAAKAKPLPAVVAPGEGARQVESSVWTFNAQTKELTAQWIDRLSVAHNFSPTFFLDEHNVLSASNPTFLQRGIQQRFRDVGGAEHDLKAGDMLEDQFQKIKYYGSIDNSDFTVGTLSVEFIAENSKRGVVELM